MKAAVFQEHGGPEKILFQDVPDPLPAEGEVLLRVKACALNHLDLWVLQGIPAYPVKRPHILGSDVAGVILKTGTKVSGWREGDKVLAAPGISCFACRYCQAGEDNLCESYSILGAKRSGGCAELLAIPSQQLIRLPSDLSFEEAAAFPLTFLTAWHMLMTRAGLREGQTVLVVGASSGVGTAAVQIAKYAGARVMATATRDEKLKRLRDLGADATVNSAQQSIAHMARAWTEGRGVDVVFEHVGPATWEQSFGSLAPSGVLVICGATTGPEVKMDLRYVFSRELAILGARMGTRRELETITELVAQKKLRPVLGATYPLAQAREALEAMAQRKHFGKIALIP